MRSGRRSATRSASPTCKADPALATNNERVRAAPALLADAARAPRAMRTRGRAGRDLIEHAGLPFAPIRKPEDLYDDPHLLATGGLADVRLPDGAKAGETVKTTLFPITMDGERLGVRLDPPRIGEHTRELLQALGFTDARHRRAARATRGGLSRASTISDHRRRHQHDRIDALALAPRACSPLRRAGRWRLVPAGRARADRHRHASSCRTPPAPASTPSRAPRSRRWRKALERLGRRREPARRRRHRRPAGAGALGAGRQHAVGGVEQRRDLPERDQVAAVRHAGRLHADRRRRRHADGAGGQPEQGAGHQRARSSSRCSRPSPARSTTRSGGNGTILHLATRAVPRRGRRHGQAHPLQGRGPDGHRPDRRPGRLRDRCAAQRAGAHQERRAARHRRAAGAAHAGRARDPDLRRAGPAQLRRSKPGSR